jgi:AhpD family alkylhydroperoxidase
MPEARGDQGAVYKAAPALSRSLLALGKAATDAGLDPALLELVNLRVSQINGCAFCLQYHTNALAKLQVDPAKLAQVAAWREASVFTAQECAALDYAEAVTRLDPHGVPDAVYQAALAAFGEVGMAALTTALVAINGWNRVAITYRFTPPAAEGRAA